MFVAYRIPTICVWLFCGNNSKPNSKTKIVMKNALLFISLAFSCTHQILILLLDFEMEKESVVC